MIKRERNGFTIVELLIVIVVIAILAAITIVAFNGITERTRTAQYASAVDATEKQLRLLGADGSLESNPLIQTCLGSQADFPKTDNFDEGECIIARRTTDGTKLLGYKFSQSSYDTLTSLNSSFIRPNKLPEVSMKSGSGADEILYYGRGLFVMALGSTATGEAPRILVEWLAPDQSGCGRGFGAIKVQKDALSGVIAGTTSLAEAESILGYEPGTLTMQEVQTLYATVDSVKSDMCILVADI